MRQLGRYTEPSYAEFTVLLYVICYWIILYILVAKTILRSYTDDVFIDTNLRHLYLLSGETEIEKYLAPGLRTNISQTCLLSRNYQAGKQVGNFCSVIIDLRFFEKHAKELSVVESFLLLTNYAIIYVTWERNIQFKA